MDEWRIGQAAAARRTACASCSAMTLPLPSHQGHVTALDSPPRFDTTCPVPRQGAHSAGGADWVSSVAAIGPVTLAGAHHTADDRSMVVEARRG